MVDLLRNSLAAVRYILANFYMLQLTQTGKTIFTMAQPISVHAASMRRRLSNMKCQAPEATTAREAALQLLLTSLKQLGTPQPILTAIHHGSSKWMSDTDPSTVKSLTCGSLHVRDIYLTIAFNEQYHSIAGTTSSLAA
jgi:hypothetical protein